MEREREAEETVRARSRRTELVPSEKGVEERNWTSRCSEVGARVA